MLNDSQCQKLANYCRTKVISLLDATTAAVVEGGRRSELAIPHKGFYIGVIDADGNELTRSGFLRTCHDVQSSSEIASKQTADDLRISGTAISKVHSSTFYCTIVNDVTYIQNPMHWQEDSDGVYFMWGQSYRGLYLPYQIKRMGISKVEVLDRLCTWEAGVASNLWRLPEGLVWRLGCQSFSL